MEDTARKIEIPCKETKCLKYPICKEKITIFCTALYQYLYKDNEQWHHGFYSLPHLIDVYRDRNYLENHLFDGAPIINSTRLMNKVERDNRNE